jgi:hypothetical protein
MKNLFSNSKFWFVVVGIIIILLAFIFKVPSEIPG